jgi:DNA-binding response OmpR family regulator
MGLILLVEDDDLLADLVAEALTVDGHEVAIARTARGAVDVALGLHREGRAIALVLTDVMLPDGHGPEVAERIREWYPRIPVLFMSGYGSEATKEGAPPDVIRKPFRLSEVLDRVRAMTADRG